MEFKLPSLQLKLYPGTPPETIAFISNSSPGQVISPKIVFVTKGVLSKIE